MNPMLDSMPLYERKALLYAEKYGIVQYKVVKNIMIYNVSYDAYLQNPHYTIQHRVNLDTGEVQSQQLKRFDKKGFFNR